jgi:5'-nucleotidase
VSDIVLARNTKNIDLIIGGHTHTFLTQPDVQKNADGKDVTINQVGWAGINLGRIDYFFSPLETSVRQGVSSVVEISEANC